jgi:hypothetical protein
MSVVETSASPSATAVLVVNAGPPIVVGEGFQNAGSVRERSVVALSSLVAPFRGGATYTFRGGATYRFTRACAIPNRARLRNRWTAAPDQGARRCCPWRQALRASAHAPFVRLSRLLGWVAVAGQGPAQRVRQGSRVTRVATPASRARTAATTPAAASRSRVACGARPTAACSPPALGRRRGVRARVRRPPAVSVRRGEPQNGPSDVPVDEVGVDCDRGGGSFASGCDLVAKRGDRETTRC